jgi:DnaJ-class molecular chaperone
MTEKSYSEQPCGYCKGAGKVDGEECIACKGKAMIMVAEPPKQCQFCKGQGYMIRGSPCRTCKGTGWMGVKKS